MLGSDTPPMRCAVAIATSFRIANVRPCSEYWVNDNVVQADSGRFSTIARPSLGELFSP